MKGMETDRNQDRLKFTSVGKKREVRTETAEKAAGMFPPSSMRTREVPVGGGH